MGSALMSVAAAALAAAASLRAETSLEPIFGRGYGSTLYRLEMTFPLTNAGDSLPENTKGLGQSELEYPLDALVAGARYRQTFQAGDGRSIGLRLAGWTNVSEPDGRMQDSDWFGARASTGVTTSSVLFKFSYTRSRAELRWLGGEAGVDIGDYSLLGRPVRYGLLVRAERMDYRLYGADGWNRAPGETTSENVSFSDSNLVLRYGLTRVQPRLTAEMRFARSTRTEFKIALSAAPAMAWDHDDHVIRKKESDTFAFGYEIGAGAEWDIRITDHFLITLVGDAAYFRAKGEMNQRFYGDDPGTAQNETGTTIDNVVTRIIGLGGGLTFGTRFLF